MYYSTFLTALFVLLCTAATVGHAQQELTLEESIRIALENNYGVRIARSTAEITRNDVTLGNAGFLPVIGATASYNGGSSTTRQEYNTGSITDRTGATSTTLSSRIGLDWTLFDGFRMFVDYDRLKTLRDAGEVNSRRAMEGTVLNVTSAYFDLIRQQYLIRAYRNALELSRERIRLAEARSSVGTGATPDLLKARVDLNADSSNLIRQEIAFSTTRTLFNTLLGRAASTSFTVDSEIPPAGELTYEELRSAAFARNSTLRTAELNRELAQLDLDAVRSLHYPSLIFSLGYGYSQANSEAGLVLSNRSHGPTYGLTLGWTLFDGFNVQRQAENARMFIDIRNLELEELRTSIEADLLTAYTNYEMNRNLLELEQNNLEAARRNEEIATERLRVGTITSYELREIQRDLIEAESRIITTRYQSKIAETQLLLLSGSLLR